MVYIVYMKKLLMVAAVLLAGIGVALTYFIFEGAVRQAIEVVWNTWVPTETYRLLVVPLVFGLTYVFFWLQHVLDRGAEKKEEHGLGSQPRPTLANFGKVLLIGFFSLLAGASLGPEAILVPASMILGSFIGTVFFGSQRKLVGLVAAAGIIALFTAFFHSFVVGLLSIFLVMKQTNAKLSLPLIGMAILAAGSSYLTLSLLPSEAAIQLPAYSWHINVATLLLMIGMAVAGFALIWLMYGAHKLFEQIYTHPRIQTWYIHAGLAALGLSVLYLLGGSLVEFTGNHSIVPLFKQEAALGLAGIVWILLVKVAAIAWSKASGYRGGMIFPTIFLACGIIAIVQLSVPDLNLIYGLIAALVGAFVANEKTRILA